MSKFKSLKILAVIFLVTVAIAVPALAQIVPCGRSGQSACTVCDFFKLLQNLINFMLYITASLATLMATYIAFLFLFSGGSPQRITDAKSKLWLLVWGIIVVLGSWLVINTVLSLVVDRNIFPWPWNQIQCSVSGGGGGPVTTPGNKGVGVACTKLIPDCASGLSCLGSILGGVCTPTPITPPGNKGAGQACVPFNQECASGLSCLNKVCTPTPITPPGNKGVGQVCVKQNNECAPGLSCIGSILDGVCTGTPTAICNPALGTTACPSSLTCTPQSTGTFTCQTPGPPTGGTRCNPALGAGVCPSGNTCVAVTGGGSPPGECRKNDGSPPPSFPKPTLSEQEARSLLQKNGISVNKNACPAGVRFQDVPGGCTSLEGVKTATIEGAITIKKACNCQIVITGGTELGHDDTGVFTHRSGNKLDFSLNPALNKYILASFNFIGKRSDGALQYRAPDGTLAAKEGDHWDMTFVK